MRNAQLEEAQAGIKPARRNINNLRYTDDTTLMAEREELKSLLMKVKEESGKAGLKLNIQKTKMMVSGPITSWQIDAETMKTVRDFIFGGSKITADGDCSHEIKRCLLLGRKAMYDQLRYRIKKQRHYSADKCPSGQSYGFSSSHVWLWELDYKESWCFWTVVLEKTLESPLDSKEIRPVHPKEISPEYSLEGLMLKLQFQYTGHLMWRTHLKRPWCWERLKAGREGDDRGWDGWMTSPTQ